MSARVKLTIAAANQILKGVKWRRYQTEYQVMVPNPHKGLSPWVAATLPYYGRIWPQDNYRDALLEIERLPVDQRASAEIWRVVTERPR